MFKQHRHPLWVMGELILIQLFSGSIPCSFSLYCLFLFVFKFFKYDDSRLVVHGSGRKSFPTEFGHFIKKNQSDIVFIYESKLPKCMQEAFCRRWDSLLSFFFVPSEGCWKNISATILQATKNFIHGWIVALLTHKFFNFCGIYGSSDYNSKLFVMRNIINLISDEPGSFVEILILPLSLKRKVEDYGLGHFKEKLKSFGTIPIWLI